MVPVCSYGPGAWRGLELRLSGVPRTGGPVDTAYGIREGRHLDPDGDLLRFGCPLPSSG
jgi:hypothetical protein